MDEKINLSALVPIIARNTGLSRRSVETFLKELFNAITQGLIEGDTIKVGDIGVFKAQKVSPRKSVSVTTGENIEIPSHVKAVFTPDKALAAAINEPFEMFEAVELADDVTEEMLSAGSMEEENTSFIPEPETHAKEDTKTEKSVYSDSEPQPEDVPDDSCTEDVSSELTYEKPIIETEETKVSAESEDTEYHKDQAIPEENKGKRHRIAWGWFFTGFASAVFVAGIIFTVWYGLNVRPKTVAEETMIADTITAVSSDNTATSLSDTETIVQDSAAIEADTKPSDTPAKDKYDIITRTRYLTTMSREYYGNYHFWPYIYEENKDILGHPDRIRPGTRVKIPDLGKYGVSPDNPKDLAEAKRKGVAIYAHYNK